MQTHISNVVGHYKGRCYAWDVVNEVVDDDGSWRSTVFLNTFNGTSYVPVAFNLAKAADPGAKLYYNDYNLEYNGAKTDKAVELVKLVQVRQIWAYYAPFQLSRELSGAPLLPNYSRHTSITKFVADIVE